VAEHMSLKSLEAAILTGILGLWLPAAAAAQTKAQAPPPASSKTPAQEASKAPTKLPLKDVGVISTAEAAREAAEAAHKAAQATKAKAPQGQATSKSGQAEESGVMEFQPVKSDSSADSPFKDAHLKDHQKPLLKDFHGSVYGAAAGQGAAERTAAGAAGASSGNGKLNVFVEGQHSQANNPGPH